MSPPRRPGPPPWTGRALHEPGKPRPAGGLTSARDGAHRVVGGRRCYRRETAGPGSGGPVSAFTGGAQVSFGVRGRRCRRAGLRRAGGADDGFRCAHELVVDVPHSADHPACGGHCGHLLPGEGRPGCHAVAAGWATWFGAAALAVVLADMQLQHRPACVAEPAQRASRGQRGGHVVLLYLIQAGRGGAAVPLPWRRGGTGRNQQAPRGVSGGVLVPSRSPCPLAHGPGQHGASVGHPDQEHRQ